MTTADQITAARDQLVRTLGFFPRVDSKASVILAVATSMLALLTARAAPYVALRWKWLPVVIAASLLAMSLWHVYREAFPALDGGEDSLLYFREISKRSEHKYATEWKAMTEEDYLHDMLGQIWRNSYILTEKFNHIRSALSYLIAAIAPWLLAIAWLSWNAAQSVN